MLNCGYIPDHTRLRITYVSPAICRRAKIRARIESGRNNSRAEMITRQKDDRCLLIARLLSVADVAERISSAFSVEIGTPTPGGWKSLAFPFGSASTFNFRSPDYPRWIIAHQKLLKILASQSAEILI